MSLLSTFFTSDEDRAILEAQLLREHARDDWVRMTFGWLQQDHGQEEPSPLGSVIAAQSEPYIRRDSGASLGVLAASALSLLRISHSIDALSPPRQERNRTGAGAAAAACIASGALALALETEDERNDSPALEGENDSGWGFLDDGGAASRPSSAAAGLLATAAGTAGNSSAAVVYCSVADVHGLTLEEVEMGAVALAVAPGGAAARAGVAPGSVLLEVNGHSVLGDELSAIVRRLHRLRSSRPLVLRIGRPGGGSGGSSGGSSGGNGGGSASASRGSGGGGGGGDDGSWHDAVFWWHAPLGVEWGCCGDFARVRTVTPWGPAAAAGVFRGALLVRIGGFDAASLSFRNAVAQLRSKRGGGGGGGGNQEVCVFAAVPREDEPAPVTQPPLQLPLPLRRSPSVSCHSLEGPAGGLDLNGSPSTSTPVLAHATGAAASAASSSSSLALSEAAMELGRGIGCGSSARLTPPLPPPPPSLPLRSSLSPPLSPARAAAAVAPPSPSWRDGVAALSQPQQQAQQRKKRLRPRIGGRITAGLLLDRWTPVHALRYLSDGGLARGDDGWGGGGRGCGNEASLAMANLGQSSPADSPAGAFAAVSPGERGLPSFPATPTLGLVGNDVGNGAMGFQGFSSASSGFGSALRSGGGGNCDGTDEDGSGRNRCGAAGDSDGYDSESGRRPSRSSCLGEGEGGDREAGGDFGSDSHRGSSGVFDDGSESVVTAPGPPPPPPLLKHWRSRSQPGFSEGAHRQRRGEPLRSSHDTSSISPASRRGSSPGCNNSATDAAASGSTAAIYDADEPADRNVSDAALPGWFQAFARSLGGDPRLLSVATEQFTAAAEPLQPLSTLAQRLSPFRSPPLQAMPGTTASASAPRVEVEAAGESELKVEANLPSAAENAALLLGCALPQLLTAAVLHEDRLRADGLTRRIFKVASRVQVEVNKSGSWPLPTASSTNGRGVGGKDGDAACGWGPFRFGSQSSASAAPNLKSASSAIQKVSEILGPTPPLLTVLLEWASGDLRLCAQLFWLLTAQQESDATHGLAYGAVLNHLLLCLARINVTDESAAVDVADATASTGAAVAASDARAAVAAAVCSAEKESASGSTCCPSLSLGVCSSSVYSPLLALPVVPSLRPMAPQPHELLDTVMRQRQLMDMLDEAYDAVLDSTHGSAGAAIATSSRGGGGGSDSSGGTVGKRLRALQRAILYRETLSEMYDRRFGLAGPLSGARAVNIAVPSVVAPEAWILTGLLPELCQVIDTKRCPCLVAFTASPAGTLRAAEALESRAAEQLASCESKSENLNLISNLDLDTAAAVEAELSRNSACRPLLREISAAGMPLPALGPQRPMEAPARRNTGASIRYLVTLQLTQATLTTANDSIFTLLRWVGAEVFVGSARAECGVAHGRAGFRWDSRSGLAQLQVEIGGGNGGDHCGSCGGGGSCSSCGGDGEQPPKHLYLRLVERRLNVRLDFDDASDLMAEAFLPIPPPLPPPPPPTSATVAACSVVAAGADKEGGSGGHGSGGGGSGGGSGGGGCGSVGSARRGEVELWRPGTVGSSQPVAVGSVRFSLMCERLGPVERPHMLLYKRDDDIRQDALVMQLIGVMDRLLRRRGLDLHLVVYRAVPTGRRRGVIEWVENAVPLSTIAEEHRYSKNPVADFFRRHKFCAAEPMGIDPAVADRYLCSCAGYCVINYLLGIGDRHQENLLLLPDGRFFHVDFSYVLGNDPKFPKVFPIPMRFTQEMLQGMGGRHSAGYARFRELCAQSFLALRQSAVVLLSLVRGLVDAGLPDLSIRQEPGEVLMDMHRRFCPDLDESGAVRHVLRLVDGSASALYPLVYDEMHKLGQMLQQR